MTLSDIPKPTLGNGPTVLLAVGLGFPGSPWGHSLGCLIGAQGQNRPSRPKDARAYHCGDTLLFATVIAARPDTIMLNEGLTPISIKQYEQLTGKIVAATLKW